MFKKSARGFTLVELLVVIAIIAILAAVVLLIINPLELTRRSRDANRLTELATLQQAINVAVQEVTTTGNVILCNNAPYPCTGHSTDTPAATARLNNGTGWVKVNLSSVGSVSVPTLPVDPTNTTGTDAEISTTTGYHYTYCANNDAWEIATVLESQQQDDKMNTDGGDDPFLYEVGSNLNLINPTGLPCNYDN